MRSVRKRKLPLVDRLRVTAPCDVGWDAMEDLGTHRHCAKCESTVHDVATMTRVEVEKLLEARERGERVCLHLHVRRTDGAVLVADGFVERARRGPPSRLIAAAVATATAMTACSPAMSPPKAPQNEIAIAPVENVASTPVPIETAPSSPALPREVPPPEAPPAEEPLPVTTVTPVKPSPARPGKAVVAKPPKNISPKAPNPAVKQLDIIDGGAF
jgi:hypothetical protein